MPETEDDFNPARELIAWVVNNTPAKLYQTLKQSVFGQDETLRKISILLFGFLKSITYESLPDLHFHFLIEGTSGCGKTTFANALKKCVPLPVMTVDASQLTSAGFKGTNVSELLGSPDLETWQCGILILDELDKLMSPSYDSSGKNVHLETLHNLLALMDGSKIHGKDGATVDCSRILVIGMGAFASLREEKKDTRHPIGFDRSSNVPELYWEEEYPEIGKSELLDFCGSEQLLGRFSTVFHFAKPSEMVFQRVIEKTLAELRFLYGDVSLPFSVRQSLIEGAMQGEYGCRGITSAVWETFLNGPQMYNDETYRRWSNSIPESEFAP